MNTLAFDTSGPILSVALQCGSSPIQEKVHFGALEHMEHLLPFVDELLKAQKLNIDQIDQYLINRGPGSFTGLRIGFACLKGLVVADSKPCFSADALDVLAERIPVKNEKYLAICLDAFRGQFYVKVFENQKNEAAGKWNGIAESKAIPSKDVASIIPSGAFIAGDALRRYIPLFESAGKNFNIAPEELWYPRASSLIHLQKSSAETLKKLVSLEDFLPAYLRLSEPEERQLEKK